MTKLTLPIPRRLRLGIRSKAVNIVPHAVHCDKAHEPLTTTDVIIQRGWVHFENVGDGLHRHTVRIDCSSRFKDLFAINSRRTPL